MKTEIKALYRKDPKLARRVASALGYKITTTAAKSDKIIKDAAQAVIKESLNFGLTPEQIKKELSDKAKDFEKQGFDYLKVLMKKAMR